MNRNDSNTAGRREKVGASQAQDSCLRRGFGRQVGRVFGFGIFGVLILVLLVAFPTETAYAVSYTYNKVITIDNTKVSGSADHTSFPVLVSVTDADLKTTGNDGHVQNINGWDIAFSNLANTTVYDHEIEKYVASTGEFVAWVRIPTLDYNDNTQFRMSYGASGVESDPSKASTWDEYYVMVQHLQETTGTRYDATSNDNDGTFSGTVQDVSDKIDGTEGFGGTSEYITVANSASLDMGNTFTASLWARYTDGDAPDNYERMLTRKSAYTDLNGWEFSLGNPTDNDALTVRGSSSLGTDGAQNVVPSWFAGLPGGEGGPGVWYHIAVVYNSTTATVYRDGVKITDVTIASVVDNDLPLYIGRYGESVNHCWVGYLDEIRLSDIIRSADWITTCYNNQNDPGDIGSPGFMTFGSESTDDSLPVELSAFTATAGNGKVMLRWVTESEIENLGFNIYRSQNHNDQLSIINDQLIPGAGSSSSRHEYEYVDKGLTNGVTYWYKLEDVDYSGNTELHCPVSAIPIAKATPSEFRLYPNYPNPFNPVTTISYDLPEDGYIELSIYNMRGEKVTTLLKGNQEAGSYRMNWNGTNRNGEIVSSGIYFLRIVSGSYCKTSKMVFIR